MTPTSRDKVKKQHVVKRSLKGDVAELPDKRKEIILKLFKKCSVKLGEFVISLANEKS